MNDTKKMLRVIINGQSAMKSELIMKIDNVDKKVDKVREDLRDVEKNLTKRIDKIGLQVAKLEDDTPTIEEFDGLEKRVGKLEHTVASV